MGAPQSSGKNDELISFEDKNNTLSILKNSTEANLFAAL